jgi:uncharacterized protein YgbK (DUF1537 family)
MTREDGIEPVRATDRGEPRWTVVLDDDPTGTQGLGEVPVVVRPGRDTFDWALGRSHVTYVSTNTRAMDADTTAEYLREVVGLAEASARDAQRRIRFVSRGDSTLRGHFPVEVQTVLDDSRNYSPIGCLLVPAFPAAGRLTIDGVHLVEQAGELVPVASTEYAHDATFGFDESILVKWARERVPSSWNVVDLPSSVFDAGIAAVSEYLVSQPAFSVVCPSIRGEHDLQLLAAAQRLAEDRGVEYIVQAGPAYPRHLAELPVPAPVEARPPHRNGIVVAGSHTATTTTQLRRATQNHGLVEIELDVAAVTGDGRRAEVARCSEQVIAALSTSSVVVATSRDRMTGDSATASLEIANQIASALSEVTRAALAAGPGFIIAKGGITSRDAVADSLGWDAATVVGPLVDQTLPVWRSWRDDATDPLCVIFPGNVGASDLLDRALNRLAELANDPHSRTTERTARA